MMTEDITSNFEVIKKMDVDNLSMFIGSIVYDFVRDMDDRIGEDMIFIYADSIRRYLCQRTPPYMGEAS